MAWAKNGSDTLGGLGDLVTITQSAFVNNVILCHVTIGNTTLNYQQTFNNNTNAVYSLRSTANGVADTTTGATTSISLALDFSGQKFFVNYVCAVVGVEKLMTSFVVTDNITAGPPTKATFAAKFVPAPDADITRTDYLNTQAGDYGTGSNLSAMGTD